MKLFVWDFHGTLEKGNELAAIEFSNLALERQGFRERFTDDHVDKLYGLKWYQYFEYLLPNHSHETHLKLQDASFALNDTHWHLVEKHIQPNDHSIAVLDKIAKSHDQILISNTNQASLEKFIQVVKMNNLFARKAFGVDGHKKGVYSTKVEVLKDYLSRKKFDQIIVIGDSEGDMRLGEAVGGTRYLYIHPGKEHRKVDADYKITDLREVLKEI